MSSKSKTYFCVLLSVCLVFSSLAFLGRSAYSSYEKAQSSVKAYGSSESDDGETLSVTGNDGASADADSEGEGEYTAENLSSALSGTSPKAQETVDEVFNEFEKYGIINKNIVTLNGQSFDISTIDGAIGALTNIRSLENFKYFAFSGLESVFGALLGAINKAIPEPQDVVAESSYVSNDFYPGHDSFVTEAAADAKWSLGYAQASLVPDDVLSRPYYLGGYLLQNFPSNTVETVLDDMKVRCTVLDDGRGKVIFATIDAIGIANYDVRRIRAAIDGLYSGNDIVSINIFTTHCHSCIDTQGLWNPFFLKMGSNYIANTTGSADTLCGPDEQFMQLVISRTASAVISAINGMTEGELYSCSMEIPEYISDTRSPDAAMTSLNRMRFVPDDTSIAETYIVNMPAHPYITGLKTDKSSGKELSADYVYYAEETVNKAGYNFMFINGAICGIYSARGLTGDGIPTVRRSEEATRYGNEIGRMLLSMTLTQDEIIASPDWLSNKSEADTQLASGNADYSVWYEGWTPVSETEVQPILNVAVTEVLVPVTNPVIQVVGKLNLANNTFVKKSDGALTTVSEIGYLEIGKDIKIALVPGEFSPELITGGGALDAGSSFSGTAYGYKSFNEIVSAKTGSDTKLLAFGEANDGCGYVVPDNDYAMIFFDDDFFGNHYQETISYGEHTASTFTNAFSELIDGVIYE